MTRTPDPWPAPRFPHPVDLTVRLPGSKSQTNRALVLGALAVGPSTVRQPLRARDTTLMADALTALGAVVDTTGEDWHVTPLPRGTDRTPGQRARIDCGLSGTVARFVPPVAALTDLPCDVDGDPHMRQRPMAAIITALRALGVEVADGDTARLPFTVRGRGHVHGGHVRVDASGSSQFVSALLLAGAAYEDGVTVQHVGGPLPSAPHVAMTVAMLRERGVVVADDQPDRWQVLPGPVAALDAVIEPDLSTAAPFLGLAAVSAGRVTVPGWPAQTTQAGDRLPELLTRMGCTTTRDDAGLTVQGPERLQGIDVDLHDVSELTPAVAALCALADSPSRLRGVGHIRGHETDRLRALASELGERGADVTEHEDGLSIAPAPLRGGLFHTYADHRMAHAATILGARVDGVLVEDVTCTDKTFPGFADVWTSLQ